MNYRSRIILFPFQKLNYLCRFYSRNVLRRNALKLLSSSENPVTSLQTNHFKPEIKFTNQNNDSLHKISSEIKTNAAIDLYKTLEKNDSLVMRLLHIHRKRKVRERKGKILLDGTYLINQAINAHLKPNYILFCREEDLKEINFKSSDRDEDCPMPKLFKVASRTMQLFSSQLIGVFDKPTYESIKCLSKPVLPVTILCDNIRDPGNLGSIIRHAAASGCQNIMLLKGCADPWETKALKVGCGGHFHVPIHNNIELEDVSNFIDKGSKIFIADNSSDIDFWEQTEELINYDACPKEIEDGSVKTITAMPLANDCEELDKLEDTDPLPCYLYSSIMYPRESIVLYVGGETHGVDARIVKLACDHGGNKVKIPLENRMDSLNSSFALAIILYEIKRQLSEKI